MPRTSESLDTDLAILAQDETSALHDAIVAVGTSDPEGGA